MTADAMTGTDERQPPRPCPRQHDRQAKPTARHPSNRPKARQQSILYIVKTCNQLYIVNQTNIQLINYLLLFRFYYILLIVYIFNLLTIS